MKIKPKKLQVGDKVALVSLSSGLIGEDAFIHKYHIAKSRLLHEFGVELVPMKHALLGIDYLYKHPEARAQDLMEAFANPEIKGIFAAIGGDDTIRLLPFIDFAVIASNPKIFMGYSDTTVNHFMLHKANLISFYGPAIMTDFGEYVEMHAYSKQATLDLLFSVRNYYSIEHSKLWSKDFVPWNEENQNIAKVQIEDANGYEILQGDGCVSGALLGGCIEMFPLLYETELWPNLEDWEGKILFIETSEMKTDPLEFKILLRSLSVQGILHKIKGLLVGKPYQGVHYEAYKTVILDVLQIETGVYDLPVFYNVNIGHAIPTGIFPVGALVELNCNEKTIAIIESFLVE